MRRWFLAVLALVVVFSMPGQVQSPVAVEVFVDPALTDEFLRLNKSRTDDTSYNEYLGLMTKAERGEHFGDLEAEVIRNSHKRGNNRKAELARMVLSRRNTILRLTKHDN